VASAAPVHVQLVVAKVPWIFSHALRHPAAAEGELQSLMLLEEQNFLYDCHRILKDRKRLQIY
jgi:hypothetical protein